MAETDRIRPFSDGVFAIAITLLAIDLRLPAGTTAANLGRTLLAQRTHYFAFTLSFLIVGSFWAGHRRIFSHVANSDDRLVWLNLLVLLAVAFLPFPSSVVASFGDTAAGVVFYASSMVVVGLAMTLLWLFVGSSPEIREAGFTRRTFVIHLVRGLIVPVVFGLSIPLAFVSPATAVYSWLAIGVGFVAFDLIANGLPEKDGGRHA